jgi:SAM-dependent methyltransferase
VADEALAWLGTHLPDDVFGDTVSAGRVVPLASTETSVPLPDASADVVAMINVHHELDDRAAMLRESARLLRPGGRLLIVDWKDEATPKGPPLAARIPARTIVREIEEAGLVDVRRHEVLPHHTMVTATRA